MKIRIIHSVLLHPEGEVGPGEVRDVPDEVGERFIRIGYAVAEKQPRKTTKP